MNPNRNIPLLTKIAKWLESGAHAREDVPGFNILSFYDEDYGGEPPLDYEGRSCGTTMCIAGAAIVFSNEYVDPDFPSSQAYKLLRLTHESAWALFYDGMGKCSGPHGAAKAAAVVRHLIATGEVDWNV